MEIILGYLAGPHLISKAESLSLLWSAVVTMQKWSKRCSTEDRGRSHKPRNTGSLQKLEKARKQMLP